MQNATEKEFVEVEKKAEIICQLAIHKKNKRIFCI